MSARRRRLLGSTSSGCDWSRGKGMRMSTFMNWLFHRGRTDGGSGEGTRTSRPLMEEDAGQERRMASLTAEGGPGTGLTQPSAGTLSIGFEALEHRLSALIKGLAPVHEKADLVTFVGTGITDPNRYEDAATPFKQLRLM